jgi:hypothetical protein
LANPIKYNTGTETQALNSGNWWIGTGDVGKGPTSTTGYYNGISPPSGGYTIYLNKSTDGPVIYECQNDSELIDITNKISGNSYSTASECLSYFSGQLDKVCFNRDYESIVTDRLVLNLDAGFTPSYPKNGTTWYDLSGNGNNGTLTNGPVYDNGSIVFDGTNDTVSTVNNTLFESECTVSLWFSRATDNSSQRLIRRLGANINRYYLLVSPNGIYGVRGQNTSRLAPFSSSIGEWINVTWQWRLSDTMHEIYVNGNLNYDGDFDPQVDGGDTTFGLAQAQGVETWFSGNVATAKVYNRALSASEVLQNFNAQKGRFGL